MYNSKLYNTIYNINKLCFKINLEHLCLKNIRNPISSELKPKLNLSLLNKNNIYVKDYINLQPYLQWNRPTHLSICNKQNILNGMKTAIIVGDENYGSLMHHNDIEIGYCYFKPNWFYDAHCHRTEELYYILYGNAQFGKGYNDNIIYKNIKENDIIYHSSFQPHAMKFNDSPVLSIYIWYRKGEYYFL